MPNKISVVIITKNEETNIKGCLESVLWADEIIVVDSGSTDKTIQICNEFNVKLFMQEWEGFAEQKKYALSLASNEWVLSLDADERVSRELSDEILQLVSQDFAGYYIKRDNYFLGKLIKGSDWGNDYQLRLFIKDKTSLNKRLVHEKFEVEGQTSQLKNTISHYSYRNLKDAFVKINHYSTLEAIEKQDKRSSSWFAILLTPLIAFIQIYVLKRGFIDGFHGLLVGIMHAITKLQVRLKIWEIKRNENSKDL